MPQASRPRAIKISHDERCQPGIYFCLRSLKLFIMGGTMTMKTRPERAFLRGLRNLAIAAVSVALSASASLAQQTSVKPGFNLFSAQQDIDLGRQSATEIERQLPILRDAEATRYVARVGDRLVRVASGPKFPYQFKVVNLSDINAFALPGGFIYLHRGLLERVRTEGELAGVMAHEMAHVALRHQTNQVSKAYLAQAGVGILGGLFGGKSQSQNQIMQAVGGIGLNSLFLKFSRSAEQQADIVGSQTMSKAGYDPSEMASFFDLLRTEAGKDPSKVEKFFSDHPAPADRAARIRKEAQLIGAVRRAPPVGDLRFVQAQLRRYPPAPTLAQALKGQTTGTSTGTSGSQTSIEIPSARYRLYRQPRGLFEVQYPENWHPYASSYGATIAPNGGIVNTSGRQELRSGIIVNHYVPFDGAVGARYQDPSGSLYGNTSLENATSDLVRQLMSANPYLRQVPGSERRGTVSGARSISVALAGSSPGGERERVNVTTRELSDGHVIYVVTLAPDSEYATLRPAFDRIVGSLRVNEQALHE